MQHALRHIPPVFLFDVMLFLFCLFGVYRIAEKAGVPADFDKEKNHVAVTKIHVSADKIGLQPFDRVRLVNGFVVSSPDDIEFILDGLRIGDVAMFEVERETQIESIPIVLVPHYGMQYIIILVLVGGIFLAVGLLVLVKRPKDRAATIFFWATVSVAVMMMTTWGRYTIKPLGLGHAVMVLNSMSYSFVPVLFLHFALVFPRRKWPSANKPLILLYCLGGAIGLWRGTTFILSTFPISMDWFHRFTTAFDVNRWFFVLCVIIALANMVHSYRTAAEEAERRKLRWVILGLAIGPLGFIALWQIPEVLGFQPLVPEEFILVISAVIPITFAISIVRYHLMDIDLIVNRSTVYAIVLAGLLTVYALVVAVVAAIVGTFTVTSSLVASAVAAIVVAVLFEPARARIQRFVDKQFFRVRYNFREVQHRFIEEIKGCLDVKQLAELIVSRTEELIPVARIGFFTLEKPSYQLRLLAHRYFDLLAIHSVRFQIEKLASSLHLPVALDDRVEPGVPIESADRIVFHRWGLVLVFPMLSDGTDILGFLALGEKKSGTKYSVEDVDLLGAVASEAGSIIARINLQQKLLLEQSESQRLEELNRLKSYFVSSVSHDLKTPLTSIRMFAEILRSKKNTPTKKVREYLQIIEGESERLTRLINNVLDFSKLERGVKEYHFSEFELNELVSSVLKSLSYQFKMEKFRVQVHLSKNENIVCGDVDVVTEALTNLLSNAMKYSVDRKHIEVSTFRKKGFMGISVGDKGIGIAADELRDIFEPFYRAKDEKARQLGGAGLGLSIVRQIMNAHHGKVEVSSLPGRGSKFTLLFPAEAHHETNSYN